MGTHGGAGGSADVRIRDEHEGGEGQAEEADGADGEGVVAHGQVGAVDRDEALPTTQGPERWISGEAIGYC